MSLLVRAASESCKRTTALRTRRQHSDNSVFSLKYYKTIRTTMEKADKLLVRYNGWLKETGEYIIEIMKK